MSTQEKYNAMQAAFKQGLITYPRSNDKVISEESITCIYESAKIFGLSLRNPVFAPLNETSVHQAPCLTPKGVGMLKKHKHESSNNVIFYILRKIALLQLRSGIPKQVKRIKTEEIDFPEDINWVKEQKWHREQYDNHYINSISGVYDDYKSSTYNAYDEDKAIIKTMQYAKLGTSATQIDNTQRFIKLKLYNHRELALTPKGDTFVYKIDDQHNTEAVNISNAILEEYSKPLKSLDEQPELQQDQEYAVKKSIDALIGSNNRRKQTPM